MQAENVVPPLPRKCRSRLYKEKDVLRSNAVYSSTHPPPSFTTDIRRTDRPALRKAGNLRHAFSVTSGEAFVVFDADFCPRPDFLLETIPYLADASIGILQTPQFFSRRSEQMWVEQGAGVCQELFYRMEQVILWFAFDVWFT